MYVRTPGSHGQARVKPNNASKIRTPAHYLLSRFYESECRPKTTRPKSAQPRSTKPTQPKPLVPSPVPPARNVATSTHTFLARGHACFHAIKINQVFATNRGQKYFVGFQHHFFKMKVAAKVRDPKKKISLYLSNP